LAEGIVAPTIDGLVFARTQAEWVAHKLISRDDKGTNRYKAFKQLQDLLDALDQTATSDIELLRLTDQTAYYEELRRKALELKAAGAVRPPDGALLAPDAPGNNPPAPPAPGNSLGPLGETALVRVTDTRAHLAAQSRCGRRGGRAGWRGRRR
jgi:hypothetical protein